VGWKRSFLVVFSTTQSENKRKRNDQIFSQDIHQFMIKKLHFREDFEKIYSFLFECFLDSWNSELKFDVCLDKKKGTERISDDSMRP